MRQPFISTLSAIMAALVATTATAAEPRVVWRSASSGVLATPDPVIPPPVSTFAVSYAGNRFTWSLGKAVKLTPTVRGGNGPLQWSLAVVTPLPAGVTLNPTTGVISGNAGATGRYQVSVLITDVTTGVRVSAVAVMEVVAG